MKRWRSLKELLGMPDGVVKRAMESNAQICCDNCDGMMSEIEEEFNGPLGGDWYQLEEGDDPRNLTLDEGYTIDLLSDEWNWCDSATLENGCFTIFWGVNNAGGPCLFVPDEPWVPEDLQKRLNELVIASRG